MMTHKTLKAVLVLAALAIIGLAFNAAAEAKPLKIYILAGQSNMEGHARVETFDYIGDDPKTAPMLKEMCDPDGKPTVCERVWISYLTGSPDRGMLGEGFGQLTAGYGSRSDPAEDGGKIGPEFMFGLTMQKAYDGPILIIKTAWGGKSLNTDFRPPSAGPYEFNETQLENLKNQGKDIEEVKAAKQKATGRYYRLMIDHVKKVLADPKRVVPDYDIKQSHEIAGFVWFQGWNDMVDSGAYPNRGKPGGYDLYSKLMAQFIRDVRKDLGVARLPFVIGVMGVGGMKDAPDYFRQAMAAPASLPEFQGNVVAVETAPYWDKPLADIADEMAVVGKSAYYLRKGEPRNVTRDPVAAAILDKYMGEDGKMTQEQIKAFVNEYRAKRIGPEKEATWRRGASNAGYHYLGCAKTLALIGKAFAEAMPKQEKAGHKDYGYLAPTPPMGWNSWSFFRKDIDEKKIKAVADAMVSSGMRDAGYQYLVLDDAWMAAERDKNGALQADPNKFPKGMKDIGDYIHSKGLKFGIYEDRAYRTCQSLPGSFGFEQIDMATFAAWGVDYIKMDSCSAEHNGRLSSEDYALYRKYIEQTGRPVVLSISDFAQASETLPGSSCDGASIAFDAGLNCLGNPVRRWAGVDSEACKYNSVFVVP